MSKTNTQTETPNPTPQKETNSLPNQSNNKRFTTTLNPQLLSQIKLISYFTNKTLSQCINESIHQYILQFEENNNTSIQSIINLKDSTS